MSPVVGILSREVGLSRFRHRDRVSISPSMPFPISMSEHRIQGWAMRLRPVHGYGARPRSRTDKATTKQNSFCRHETIEIEIENEIVRQYVWLAST